ncbi:MAG: M1 family metallopeptidase [Pseudonocardiales bacterium]
MLNGRAAVALAFALVFAAGCQLVDHPRAPASAAASAPTTRPGALRTDPALAGAGDPMFPTLGNAGYDIEHYDLDPTWSPDRRDLSGTVSITATALRELNTFDLDFAGMTIDRVTVDGHPARFLRFDSEVVIGPAAAVAGGATFAVAVTYNGTPGALRYAGGRSTSQLGWLSTGRTTYTTQEPYGAHGWFPCSDHPSDKASYTFHITAPAALTVVANGAMTGNPGARDTRRWTYDEPAPMATYLVTLAIGTYTLHHEKGPHGLPMTFAYFPADEAKVLPMLRKSAAQIRFFESLFGPYPFTTYGVLVTDVADDQTMETQTLVTLGRGLATDASTLYRPGEGDTVLAHELAHQWFGDAVTPARWTDMWMNEGWATYAERLYDDAVLHTPLAASLALLRLREGPARRADGPGGRPTPANMSNGHVYYGPALMLNGLRRQMGDTAFFAMARAWVHDNLGQSRTRADFTHLVRTYAHRDLSANIDQWLDSPTMPAG